MISSYNSSSTQLVLLPSVQEHTRKSLPTLVEKPISTGKQRQRVEGMTYDIDLAANAVKTMRKSDPHFQVSINSSDNC